MDFHAAMETFAEAWVAANTPTAVNVETHTHKQPEHQSHERPVSAGSSGHCHNLVLVGHGSNLTLDRTGPGIVRAAQGHGHSMDTNPKDPEHSPSAHGGSTKSLPIHCVVEQISGTPSFDNVSSVACAQNAVELDSYAILPSTTLLNDLVHSALIKLGYSSVDAMTAKGAIQIKNWKPMTFDAITNNPQASVEDILSELTNVATLRIRIASHPKPSSAEEVKEKLLQLLLSQSHSLLNQSGCPIDKGLLSSISKGDHSVKISEDLTSAFDKWYKEQLKGHLCKNGTDLVPREKTPEPEIKENELSKENSPQTSPELKDGQITTPQPYFMASRTRVRTSFDPEHEIPRLHKWFQENQHPSREQMISTKQTEWPTLWDDQAVRCATLSLLKELNQPTLAKLSPLCQSMISNIANGKYVNKLSMEKCKEFGDWYKQYKTQALDFPSTSHKGIPKDTRLTFHPQHEVPLLKNWYAKCKHPTTEKLRFYCSELNKGHIRHARPAVTPARLKLWWKNEKQKERRQRKEESVPSSSEEPLPCSSEVQINPDSSSEATMMQIHSEGIAMDGLITERCPLDSSMHNVHIPRSVESTSMQMMTSSYVGNPTWIQ